MKLKVKDLLVYKERAESVKGRMERLPPCKDDRFVDGYLIDVCDVENICGELDEYIELLDNLGRVAGELRKGEPHETD